MLGPRGRTDCTRAVSRSSWVPIRPPRRAGRERSRGKASLTTPGEARARPPPRHVWHGGGRAAIGPGRSAAAAAGPGLQPVDPAALELPPGQRRGARVLAGVPLEVALVLRLPGELAQVPAHAPPGLGER